MTRRKSTYAEDMSKGRMLRFQDSLPRLPVPQLNETMERYLKSLKALLSADEFQFSKSAVEVFIQPGGIGENLQAQLEIMASDPATPNWLHTWWNETAYLAPRIPVVPYVSYFYSYRDDRRRKRAVHRAAAIASQALHFQHLVESKELEPEYMRGEPISMDSYVYMFHGCRIPSSGIDQTVTYKPAKYRHFVVCRKGRFFKVPYAKDGLALSVSEIEAQLKQVYEVVADTHGIGLGALTSANRDLWARARSKLLGLSKRNSVSLETIQSAAFTLCLDDAAPITLEERAHQYWHGDGQNRWFDKPLNFIINDNGAAGFLGEHSMMDGMLTHRLNHTICSELAKPKSDMSSETVHVGLPYPSEVLFDVDDELAAMIRQAKEAFHDIIEQHELRVQPYQAYGKGLIKQFKASPDAFVQLIIQLAYYKMFGINRPTYESAATRKFQKGRTEACRSVSEESVKFCQVMEDPSKSKQECITSAKAALKGHVQYISDASNGHGVDRHLFALKKLLGSAELPPIFSDPAYTYSSTWFLSTSQLSSGHFNGYGWSQVVDAGFGIAYMVRCLASMSNAFLDQRK